MQTNPTGRITPKNYPAASGQALPQAEPQVGQAIEDKAEITPKPHREPSLGRKIVEGAAGFVGGVIGTVAHTPAGTLEGMFEGVKKSGDHQSSQVGGKWLLITTAAEAIAGGAAIGLMTGGLIGAAIGAGVGLVTGVVWAGLLSKADADDQFGKVVDSVVDKAVSDNTTGTKVQNTVQSAVEGAIVGTRAAVPTSWEIGREMGKGTVSGLIDVGEGIYDGVKELFKKK
jgi:hypothetical protein